MEIGKIASGAQFAEAFWTIEGRTSDEHDTHFGLHRTCIKGEHHTGDHYNEKHTSLCVSHP